MGSVIALLVLMALLGALIWPGIKQQDEKPDLPRPPRLLLLQKFGEELGFWPEKDVFGVGHPRHLLPPEPPPPEYVVPLAEMQQRRLVQEIEGRAPKTPLQGI